MKKLKYLAFAILIAGCVVCSSCGSILGGPITDCQKRGPAQGGIHRQIRPAALIGDILFFPLLSLTIDFVDGAIYVPCATKPGGPPAHYQNGRN